MATAHISIPDDITPEEARLLLAIKLFELHRISLGKAAEMAGYSKPTFREILFKQNVPILDYPTGDLNREMHL